MDELELCFYFEENTAFPQYLVISNKLDVFWGILLRVAPTCSHDPVIFIDLNAGPITGVGRAGSVAANIIMDQWREKLVEAGRQR